MVFKEIVSGLCDTKVGKRYMSDKTELMIKKICNLPLDFEKSRNKSIVGLIKESGYLEYKDKIVLGAIKAYLSLNRCLVDNWLIYSSDKRTSSGWYFCADKGVYIVGYYSKFGGNDNIIKYSDSIEACANFIRNEVNDVMRDGGYFEEFRGQLP